MIPEIHEKYDFPPRLSIYFIWEEGQYLDYFGWKWPLTFLGEWIYYIVYLLRSFLQDFLGIKYSSNFRRFKFRFDLLIKEQRQNLHPSFYSLLQGIFPTQESNLGLLQYRWIFYHLSHQGILYESLRNNNKYFDMIDHSLTRIAFSVFIFQYFFIHS